MNPLKEEIVAALKEAGRLPFARLMDIALYSEHGYYGRHVRIGREGGDFYTASQSPLFALTLAAAIEQQITQWDFPAAVQVVEVGAGQGELGRGIATKFVDSGMKTKVLYRIDEVSEYLRQVQQERLQPLHKAGSFEFSWGKPHRDIPTIIVANEVLDALPVERIRRTGDGWQYLTASLEDGEVAWQWEQAPEKIQDLASRYVDCPEGMQAEICEGYETLLDSLLGGSAPVWGIFIDYGITREEWQTGIRPEGTLRGYRNHAVVDPVHHLLEADITADVNWSLVEDVVRHLGIEHLQFQTQGQFLMNHGIIELAMAQQQTEKDLLAGNQWIQQFRQLALPEGMGDRFSVLSCHRE